MRNRRKRFWRRAGAILAAVLIIIGVAVWRAEREADPVAQQPVTGKPVPDAKKATPGSPLVHDRPDRERGPRP
jgi:hypothetical protein